MRPPRHAPQINNGFDKVLMTSLNLYHNKFQGSLTLGQPYQLWKMHFLGSDKKDLLRSPLKQVFFFWGSPQVSRPPFHGLSQKVSSRREKQRSVFLQTAPCLPSFAAGGRRWHPQNLGIFWGKRFIMFFGEMSFECKEAQHFRATSNWSMNQKLPVLLEKLFLSPHYQVQIGL